MTCLRPAVMSEPLIDVVPANQIITNNCKILELDLYTCKKEDVEFSSAYELTFSYSDSISGLIGWFDCEFKKLANPVTLTTSPYCKPTHWKQTTFYTERDISVNRGDKLVGSIAVRKSKTNFRELDIKISYHLKGYSDYDIIQQYKLR